MSDAAVVLSTPSVLNPFGLAYFLVTFPVPSTSTSFDSGLASPDQCSRVTRVARVDLSVAFSQDHIERNNICLMLCIAARLGLAHEFECAICVDIVTHAEVVVEDARPLKPSIILGFASEAWFSPMPMKRKLLSPAALKRIKQPKAKQGPAKDDQQQEDPWENEAEEEEEDPTVSPSSEAGAEAVAPAAEAVGSARAARDGGACGRRPVQATYLLSIVGYRFVYILYVYVRRPICIYI